MNRPGRFAGTIASSRTALCRWASVVVREVVFAASRSRACRLYVAVSVYLSPCAASARKLHAQDHVAAEFSQVTYAPVSRTVERWMQVTPTTTRDVSAAPTTIFRGPASLWRSEAIRPEFVRPPARAHGRANSPPVPIGDDDPADDLRRAALVCARRRLANHRPIRACPATHALTAPRGARHGPSSPRGTQHRPASRHGTKHDRASRANGLHQFCPRECVRPLNQQFLRAGRRERRNESSPDLPRRLQPHPSVHG